jgi:hypothetical protein
VVVVVVGDVDGDGDGDDEAAPITRVCRSGAVSRERTGTSEISQEGRKSGNFVVSEIRSAVAVFSPHIEIRNRLMIGQIRLPERAAEVHASDISVSPARG